MTIREGDPAPRFTLPDAPGHEVDVGERIGERPVVLLFFPLAFSSTCTAEMCAVRDEWERWEELDAAVYGISVDSPFVTERFREEHRLPFPVLSDFNREVAEAYGVLYEEFYGLEGVAKRAAFVIGQDGKIAFSWVSDDASLEPDYEAVRKATERSRFDG
ncbi:MAG: redoxin domain-containing protein [Gemmatimonadota bacterium]|nr:redoxin domain-containing protein [Gemmatimonadota bacterium]